MSSLEFIWGKQVQNDSFLNVCWRNFELELSSLVAMNVLEKAFRIKKNHANDINEFCQVGTNWILARQFLSLVVLGLMSFLTCSDNYNIPFDGTEWILGFCSLSANSSRGLVVRTLGLNLQVLGSNAIKVVGDDRKSIRSQLLRCLKNYNPQGRVNW